MYPRYRREGSEVVVCSPLLLQDVERCQWDCLVLKAGGEVGYNAWLQLSSGNAPIITDSSIPHTTMT